MEKKIRLGKKKFSLKAAAKNKVRSEKHGIFTKYGHRIRSNKVTIINRR